jgi:prophage DNA circulation protein
MIKSTTSHSESAEDIAEKTRESIQEQTAPASFTVNGERVVFALQDDKLAKKNRLVKHERPYRPGAKIDSTGSEARVWNLRAIFNNSLDEPGLDQNVQQYPDNMNKLTDLADIQATGDFVHPVDGKARARLESASRTIIHEEEDTGYLDLVFIEDNEESVDKLAFQRPSIKGSFKRLAEQTVFTAQQEGLWSTDLSTLREFASNIEGLLTFPGEYADAVMAQVRGAQRALKGILITARRTREENLSRFDDTPLKTIASVTRMLDIVGVALEEHNTGTPKKVPYVVRETTTIWAIASDVRQDAEALMEINAQRIDDPFHVQPGTYRIFSKAG